MYAIIITMIRVAHIMPTEYQENLVADGVRFDIQMSLAHLVLEDVSYRELFSKPIRSSFLILDNSAFELGESIDSNDLMLAISKVSPDEIVLPDSLYNHNSTMKLMQDFIARHRDYLSNMSLMAVPHGKSIDEYIESYRIMSSLDYVSTIGIGTIYNDKFAEDGILGREKIVRELINRNLVVDKAHHLLGLGDSGNIELIRLSKYDFIRSCDSSAAYVNARAGTRITSDGYKKDRIKVDFSANFDKHIYKIMLHNMKTLEEAAK